MDRSRPDSCRLGAVALLLVTLGLSGCGEAENEAQAPDSGASTDWSDPAAPGDVGTGSPDGDGSKPAGEVLTRLHTRLASGEGNSGPSFQQDVEAVAAVLWGAATDPKDTAPARVHVEVCNISGEVSRWLAASDEARAERTKSHPHDVGLHDAHVAALGAGADGYKAWCGGAGAKQLTALKEARYQEMFGRK